MSFDAAEFRGRQRKMWSSGNWPEIASHIQPVADELVERIDVREGQDVLDIGTGSGNVAIRAAERGARVTGSDITTEMFEAARARAAEAGVEVEWVEGDAADLPFDDDSFDQVLSVFGWMFAPRHQDAADELVRVCRPGGVIGLCAWTPEGVNGRMLKLVGSALPPPPPEVQSPILWGSEDHVRELLDGKGVELEFERAMAEWEWDSAEGWISFCEEKLGPTIAAKSVLEPEGRWDDMKSQLIEMFSEYSADDGSLRASAEYLRTIGRRTG
jgi:SAM-dependent methyltransferase